MFFRRKNDGGASALHDFLKQGVFQRNRLLRLDPNSPGDGGVIIGTHSVDDIPVENYDFYYSVLNKYDEMWRS